MSEIWKPIPHCKGYEASSYGCIRNAATGVGIWGSVCKDGYRKISIKWDGKTKTISAHRLVAFAFGIIEQKDHVNHIDGVKLNNHVSNLEKSNPKHNLKHAWRTGLRKPQLGEENHSSKLKRKQVEDLIRSYAKGEMVESISRRLCISRCVVSLIALGHTWKEFDPLRKKLGIKRRSPRKKAKRKEGTE